MFEYQSNKVLLFLLAKTDPILSDSIVLIVSTLSILIKGEQGRKLRTKYANESGWLV
ncbi:hypothetical protein VCHA50P417_70208 [Vibrio chagasii]|nr:hypothetical protein VCHA35O142_30018 [Vibrio chagasii]CAH6927729.1 hypothetical protein VCHA28O22_30198 [Vibrio chagasii]CAH7087521.1 hypothetical protein VCHA48P437_10201 [Vibrio chagasii]CAH7156946.1 hypothetical protein VCHA43P275_20006 [Vibrio chagasii]CAH7207221.1 hypothetical protein VCHA50O393_20286 [Vibrio chagasii]